MSILIKGMDMPKKGLYELSFAQSDGVTICLIEESYPDGGGRLVEHKGVVEVPTDDVRPNVHGEWVKIDDRNLFYFECSNCGKKRMFDNYDFCPNCGADMQKEVE